MKLRRISIKEAKKRRNKWRLKKLLIFTCALLLLIFGINVLRRCGRETYVPDRHMLTLSATSNEYDTITIDIRNATSVSYLKNITSIEFGKNGSLSSYDVTTRKFTNLEPNTLYTVKVSYTAPQSDGQYVTKVLTRSITTRTKNKPVLSLESVEVSDTDLRVKLFVSDKHSTLVSHKTELYLYGEQVAESVEKELCFSDLIPKTTYLLRVSATYDIGDGNGAVEKTMIEKVVKTPPQVSVSDVALLSGEIVKEGESVLLQLTLDNPNGVNIYGAIVNGIEFYTVGEHGTTESVCVEIPNEALIGFGEDEIELRIEQLLAKHETLQYYQRINAITVSVKLEEKASVRKTEFVNGNLSPANHVTFGEQLYALVTLQNPYEGIVTSARLSNKDIDLTDIVKLDNERWLIPIDICGEAGLYSVTLESITLKDDFSETTFVINKEFLYATIDHDNVHYVSTAEDLKNMNEGYYYELTGDIDLSGISWNGAEFNGFFNGCGYSIKNMSYATNATNQNAYAGLFSVAQGTIANLVIENATLLVKINVQESNEFVGYCGGIAAYARELMIVNCRVDGSCTFGISATAGTPVYCGGLVGAGSATIANSHSAARLSSSVYCGGLIGASEDSETKIKDSSNSGSISATGVGNDFFVGGLIGYGRFDISSSYNSGNVTGSTFTSVNGTACVGGVVGAGYGTLEHSYNVGNVTSNVSYAAHTGGLVGRLTETSEIKHSYSTGSVSAHFTEYRAYTGGLVGLIDKNATITTSYFSGEIICGSTDTRVVYVGGIVGALMHGSVDINNCFTEGNISISKAKDGYAGGILGYTADPKVTVSNCYSTCFMSMRYGNFFYAGGILSTKSGTITLINVFTDCNATLNHSHPTSLNYIAPVGFSSKIVVVNSYYLTVYDNLLSSEDGPSDYEVNNKLFYTSVLGWSEDIWDFSALSDEKWSYPTLK